MIKQLIQNIYNFLFTKKYGSLYSYLKRIPFISKIWREYHSPYYHWRKVNKYFKKPKTYFYKGKLQWFFGFPIRRDYLNPVIDIRFHSLGWKDKYDSPRHEWDPYISIVFFRKYQLLWTFSYYDKEESVKNMATWEAILDMIYYDNDIDKVYKNNQWKHEDKIITIESNLTDYGKSCINKTSK